MTLRRRLLLGTAAAGVTAPALAWYPHGGSSSAPTIVSVNLSNSSFNAGSPIGTVVGVISVTMSSGSFTGSLSLTGTNASSFQLVGNNLETAAILAAGTYSINVVATQAGASNSPFTQPETITGNSVSQTIVSVNLSGNNFTAGSPSGTVVGSISVTMNTGSFTGTLSLTGSNAAQFQISGVNLETNGVLSAGTYSINIVATQSSATNSPFPQPESIVGGSGPVALTVNYPAIGGTAYTYDPNASSGGAVTVTNLGNATDPLATLGLRSAAYTAMTCIEVTRSDCPVRVTFRSISGWWCAIFEYGECTTQRTNGSQYTVSGLPVGRWGIGGSTPVLAYSCPQGSRWRWESNVWPISYVSSSSLISAGFFPAFDTSIAVRIPEGDRAYTPLAWVSLGLTPNWEQTGPRDEIGLCSEFTAQYLCMDAYNSPNAATYRSQLTDTLFAVAEGANTPSVRFFDATNHRTIDAVVTYPSAGVPQWGGGYSASPILYADNYTTDTVIMTGPNGTVIPNGTVLTVTCVASSIDNPGGSSTPTSQNFTIATGGTIGSSGTITLSVYQGAYYDLNPIGGTVTAGTPSGVTGVTFSNHLGSAGSYFQTAHMGEFAALAFLLTGDWYHLECVQGFGISSFLEDAFAGGRNGSYPGVIQLRGAAWATRAIKRAWQLTPTSGTPSWVLPHSVWNAAGSGGTTGGGLPWMASYMAPAVISSAPTAQTQDVYNYFQQSVLDADQIQWQSDYLALSTADAYVGTSDANWATFAKWVAYQDFARINSTSGWGGIPATYGPSMTPTGFPQSFEYGPPYFSSWNGMWTGDVNGGSNPPPVFSTSTTGVDVDYINSMWAALAMMTQSLPWTSPEHAMASAACYFLDPIHRFFVAGGGSQACEYKWAIAQKIGVSGNVINVGPTRTYTTIAAGVAAASAGDTIVVDYASGHVYNEAVGWTTPNLTLVCITAQPNGWYQGQTSGWGITGAAIIDGTGIADGSLPHGGYGALVPGADATIIGFEIRNFGTTDVGENLVGAIRPYNGCNNLNIVSCWMHNNQNGVTAGTDVTGININILNCYLTTNGVTGSPASHNIYTDTGNLYMYNCVSVNPPYGHAVKHRGPAFRAVGCTFQSDVGYCINLPNGLTTPSVCTANTLWKTAAASQPGIMSYGDEGATNGNASVTFNKFNTLNILSSSPTVIFGAATATVTFADIYTGQSQSTLDTNFITTNLPTVSGSGTLVGVTATSPTLTATITSPGGSAPGNVLCGAVQFTGVPAPTVTYQWKSGSTVRSSGTLAPYSPGSYYQVTSADVGNIITFAVSATNSSGTITSSPTIGPVP